jgi:hypothetical protein
MAAAAAAAAVLEYQLGCSGCAKLDLQLHLLA